MSRGPSTLLIVIVNYRTAGLTIDCLRSLQAEVDALPETRVVVVDNASGDDSVDRLVTSIGQHGWEGWARVQPLAHNGGFASGNNAAIRPALQGFDPPRYVLLLNPDTIVRPGALKALLSFLEDRPEVGIVGSRLEDPDGTPQRSAFRFPSILGELEGGMRFGIVSKLLAKWMVAPPVPPETCQTDWVAGASMMIRREVFDSIGLLDEVYFLYFEEVDFCLRAKKAGWGCWYEPHSRVVHLVGQSSGVTDPRAVRKRRPRYWFLSRRRYFLSHHGALKTFLADLTWTLAFASYKLRRIVQRKLDRDPDKLLCDFINFNFINKN
jgi:N-acetylglucosaminyl-diphospho-decaprenol L-rhamnosyltransferase